MGESVPAICLHLLWFPAVMAASIFYRRSQNKPVLFFSVPNVRFQERTASAYSNDRWWQRFGAANRCLVVAVTEDRLVIRPWFPFTLMFLPEFLGLEHDVPLRSVINVWEERRLWQRIIRLQYRNDGIDGDVSLRLQRPDDFWRLVAPNQSGMERGARR